MNQLALLDIMQQKGGGEGGARGAWRLAVLCRRVGRRNERCTLVANHNGVMSRIPSVDVESLRDIMRERRAITVVTSEQARCEQ